MHYPHTDLQEHRQRLSSEAICHHMRHELSREERRAIVRGIETWKRNGKQEPIWLCFQDQQHAWDCMKQLKQLLPEASCLCMGNVVILKSGGADLQYVYNLYKVQQTLPSKLNACWEKKHGVESDTPIHLDFETGEQAHLAHMLLHQHYGIEGVYLNQTPRVIISLDHLKQCIAANRLH